MCGIAGIVRYDGSPVGPGVLSDLAGALAHRGPDDTGFLAWRPGTAPTRERAPDVGARGSVGLVHRRLSIIDLGEGGWQPMLSTDGRYAIAFNGEIYNFVELRRELEALGHKFWSRSDTEVLLAAFGEWGTDALCRLVGMFAFCILDMSERRFVLARDFMGIKPLYYSIWRDGAAFASELGALHAVPGISRELDAERLYEFAAFGRADEGPRTMFKHIRQLPAGHYVNIALDSRQPILPVRYWRLRPAPEARLTFADAAERLRELFLDSIRLHLRSDVPVGACLSGGIDSSAIVMAMRHVAGPDLAIHAFSFIPDDDTLSEERYIDLVGEAADVRVHKVRPTAGELSADIDKLLLAQGEPVRGASMYAQYRVYGLARESGIKVLLNGQGADELMAGYQGATLYLRILSSLRKGRIADAAVLAANTVRMGLGPPVPELFRRLETMLSPDGASQGANGDGGSDETETRRIAWRGGPEWIDTHWLQRIGARTAMNAPGADSGSLRAALVRMVEETSLPHLLRSDDRNSMVHGIESRLPFVTPALAEFVLSLPEEYLVDNRGRTKAVFRHAMRGIVPDVILDRKDKIGFTTPLADWLLDVGDWVQDTLDGETRRPCSLFAPHVLAERYNLARIGRATLDATFWRGLNAVRWSSLVGGVYGPAPDAAAGTRGPAS